MEWIADRVDRRGVRSSDTVREQCIIALYKFGKTLEEIGSKYGVTRERIRQILKRNGLSRLDGGMTIRTFKRIPERVERERTERGKREARCQKRWGMSLDEYQAHVAQYGNTRNQKTPMGRYIIQKKNAINHRKIEWKITFKDWWQVWQESGKWEKRGRGKGYCMSRYGDSGGYEVGNIYITTNGQNSSDSYIVHSALSRIRLRGPGEKGYYASGSVNWFYVYLAGKWISRHATTEEAREAYLKAWHEKYDLKPDLTAPEKV